MEEESLHALLEGALAGEPPIGPVARNALRAGLRLRRRRRAGAGTCAVVAAVALAVPGVRILSGPIPAGPTAARQQPAGIGGKGDRPVLLTFSPDGEILASADTDAATYLPTSALRRRAGRKDSCPH